MTAVVQTLSLVASNHTSCPLAAAAAFANHQTPGVWRIKRCDSLHNIDTRRPSDWHCAQPAAAASRSQTFTGPPASVRHQPARRRRRRRLNRPPIAKRAGKASAKMNAQDEESSSSSSPIIMPRCGGSDRETCAAHARPQPYKSPSTLVVSGYTCIGKTTLQRRAALQDRLLGLPEAVQVIDMDSSAYSRDNFPANYLADIRHRADEKKSGSHAAAAATPRPRILLISTFPGVATQLRAEGYYVAQLYPDKSPVTKREWLRRLAEREERRTESRLYKLVNEMWDAWFDEMELRDVSFSVKVGADMYLSTVIGGIYEAFRRDTGQYEEGGVGGYQR